MAKSDLTAQRLRELLHYDAATGEFTSRVNRWRWKLGEKVGYVNYSGRAQICIEQRVYLAHRLAWLYVHGVWPSMQIDHINGNQCDNRLANLRDVSRQVNQQNRRKASRGSSSGYLGVSWARDRSRWVAQINVDGKQRRIGYFDDPNEAHQAYLAEKRRLHEGCTI